MKEVFDALGVDARTIDASLTEGAYLDVGYSMGLEELIPLCRAVRGYFLGTMSEEDELLMNEFIYNYVRDLLTEAMAAEWGGEELDALYTYFETELLNEQGE